ncbi:hypothetical protein MCOR02_005682 [Pyricularia oryzae]|nr:hypothetical protein MCOR02_005682 [Pyricularia oryzae]KAI6332702.1 hypothetical protein MCOR29_001227 [Pyricularia oryzae]KAI6384274.1 hypothetical protein MCOR32_002200 [Pyricularia oryzae]KAI6455630.1 hypothetical protein MCOR17_008593 [Pyricularia oryzae]KAI6567874.1 hypothetical protein MCOR09_005986 [Pyricularia oryzae]
MSNFVDESIQFRARFVSRVWMHIAELGRCIKLVSKTNKIPLKIWMSFLEAGHVGAYVVEGAGENTTTGL